jgi:hypothetical protein
VAAGIATDAAAAKRTPSGIWSERDPRERIPLCEVAGIIVDTAAAKRTPSGIWSERDPRERIPLCEK